MHRTSHNVRHESTSSGAIASSTRAKRCARAAGTHMSVSTPRRRGRVISFKSARGRSNDQRINMRRAYRTFMLAVRSVGAAAATSPFDAWPVRPYAASV